MRRRSWSRSACQCRVLTAFKGEADSGCESVSVLAYDLEAALHRVEERILFDEHHRRQWRAAAGVPSRERRHACGPGHAPTARQQRNACRPSSTSLPPSSSHSSLFFHRSVSISFEMREIVTLQFGAQSNYIGTHLLNVEVRRCFLVLLCILITFPCECSTFVPRSVRTETKTSVEIFSSARWILAVESMHSPSMSRFVSRGRPGWCRSTAREAPLSNLIRRLMQLLTPGIASAAFMFVFIYLDYC